MNWNRDRVRKIRFALDRSVTSTRRDTHTIISVAKQVSQERVALVRMGSWHTSFFLRVFLYKPIMTIAVIVRINEAMFKLWKLVGCRRNAVFSCLRRSEARRDDREKRAIILKINQSKKWKTFNDHIVNNLEGRDLGTIIEPFRELEAQR